MAIEADEQGGGEGGGLDGGPHEPKVVEHAGGGHGGDEEVEPAVVAARVGGEDGAVLGFGAQVAERVPGGDDGDEGDDGGEVAAEGVDVEPAGGAAGGERTGVGDLGGEEEGDSQRRNGAKQADAGRSVPAGSEATQRGGGERN